MPEIKRYDINTCMGRLVSGPLGNQLPFLSTSELKELNEIGYCGRNSAGDKMSREEFLNSIGKGTFDVAQTKYDNGDFCESFSIIRVVD